MAVRTRFAPSPTGFLHIGGGRTALFCFLYARQKAGKFILRIEDTDQERSTKEAIDAILDAMEWMGLNWDEGPFYQMKHLARYEAVAETLVSEGHAYHCYCSKERLENLRKVQLENKEKPRYDGHCRDSKIVDKDKPHVIRFRTPLTGEVLVEDCVHGKVSVQNSELDDLVLVRSDGIPTYNFSVVVDDIDMKITHVIRGDDHLANTPRQINIIRALGATPPIYAHVPMILGGDGKRLSKRHGAVSVQYYRDMGILPQALLNYLVRLGWSFGDQEIFSLKEMIDNFDIMHLNKAHAVFNLEKLCWLNQHYIKEAEARDLVLPFKAQLEKFGVDLKEGPSLEDIIIAQKERAKTLLEMAEKSIFFFKEVEMDEKLKEKHLTTDAKVALAALKEAFSNLSSWEAKLIHESLVNTAERLNLKLGQVAQPLRLAVTGGLVSPPIDVTLVLLGKDKTLERLGAIA